MTFLRARMSRRHALAVTALAVCPLQVSADRPSSPREPIMPPTIRLAQPHDVPEVVALLTEGAKQRSALGPLLWRIAPDAQARIEGNSQLCSTLAAGIETGMGEDGHVRS